MNKNLFTNVSQSSLSYTNYAAAIPPSTKLHQYRSYASPSKNSSPSKYSDHSHNSPTPVIKEIPFGSIIDKKTDIIQPAALHALRDHRDSEISGLTEYKISPMSRNYERPSQKPRERAIQHQKDPNVHIKLEEMDVDADELTGSPIAVRTTKRTPSHTPNPGSSIKTLTEAMEAYSGPALTPSMNSFKGSHRDIALHDRRPSFNHNTSIERLDTNPFSKSAIMFSPPKTRSQLVNTYSRKNKFKEATLNTQILKTVIGYLTCADIINFKDLIYEFRSKKSFKKVFKEQMITLMLKGLSDYDQQEYWNTILDYQRIQQTQPFTFTSQLLKHCPCVKDIQKDLDRTLPEYDKYSTAEGKDALFKVLIAISNTVTDVGYIQGLNSIAGVFLFFLKQEKAYWMVLYMMKKMNVKDILKEDFNRVHILNYQLQTFLENYVPDVANFLAKAPIEIDYFTTPWFITLFSYFLTLPNIIRTWNLFFVRGNSFLIQLGLAVFSKYKEKILSMDFDDLGSFFKYELREVTEQNESLFEEALKFRISNRLLTELEGYYKNGKPHLMLIKESNGKLEWHSLTEPTTAYKNKKNHDACSIDLSLEEPRSATGSPATVPKNRVSVQSIVKTITVELPEAFKSIFTKSPERSPNKERTNDLDSSKHYRSEQTDASDVSPTLSYDSPLRLKTPTASKKSEYESPPLKNKRSRANTALDRFAEAFSKSVNFTSGTADTEMMDTSPTFNDPSKQAQISSQFDIKVKNFDLARQESQFSSLIKLPIFSGKPTPEQSPRTLDAQKQSSDSLFSFRPQTKLNSDCITPNQARSSKKSPTFHAFGHTSDFSSAYSHLNKSSSGYPKTSFYE